MGIVSAIFETLSEIITEVVTLMTSLFEGVAGIFYSEADGLTFVGTLALVGLGISVFWLGFKFIRSWIKTKG
jgi:hypothetical protein